MYQKSSGLTKYVILLCDAICIAISLLVADYVWHDVIKHISRGGANYIKLLCILLAVYVVVFFFDKRQGDFYLRGIFLESWACIKANLFLMLGITLVMFFVKMGATYSRMVFAIFAVINCVLMTIGRIVLKKLLPYVYKKMVTKREAIIVGDSDFARDVLEEISVTKDFSVDIVGLCLAGDDASNERNQEIVAEIPTVIDITELKEFCTRQSVDEVILEVDDANRDALLPIMDELASAGIIIKYRTKLPSISAVGCQAVNKAGAYVVATYATRSVSTGSLLLKRSFDIFAGAVGSLITLVLMVFIAPAIKLESSGPVLFSQKRVGKNGRIFTIYKFRSMYADAEERKLELMKRNEMEGLMFKMEDDPRITKVGKFLRKTSLDEFPQFFNVLSGDMSLVGTRPPTLDEFRHYNLDQKGRLSFRPGLTGLWQVSGRNDINDFEEIVALDKEYIRNWSPVQDIKIILKTVPAMLSGK